MITVHHLNNSRSQRVLWLLEELGLEYEIRHYQRDPVTNLAPAELKAIHPLGKSPVITEGDKVIAETGAIVEYLIRNHGDGSMIPPRDEIKKQIDYIEYHLIGHDWFAGDEISGADIMMIFPLEACKARGRLKGYESCIEFVEKVHKRPAYLRALERGGNYDYGPKNTG